MKKLLVLIMAALMILAMAVAGCGGDDKKADNGRRLRGDSSL